MFLSSSKILPQSFGSFLSQKIAISAGEDHWNFQTEGLENGVSLVL